MTGIICAMKLEAENIIASMSDVKTESRGGIEFHLGRLAGRDVAVAVCGIGKVFAAICAQTMILCCRPDEIINVGVAGSLSAELGVFDLVVADDLVQHDMDTSALGDPKGLISGINMIGIPADPAICDRLSAVISDCGLHGVRGRIATGDKFVDSDADRRFIADEFSAVACEMEGCAVAQTCYAAGVPFAVLRAISDSGEGDYVKFAARAAENSARVICEYIARG